MEVAAGGYGWRQNIPSSITRLISFARTNPPELNVELPERADEEWKGARLPQAALRDRRHLPAKLTALFDVS